MNEGTVIAIGPCYACGELFGFDPDTVPAIPIDPDNGLPPDRGGDRARAVNRPICDMCLAGINPIRAANGLPPFIHGRRLG